MPQKDQPDTKPGVSVESSPTVARIYPARHPGHRDHAVQQRVGAVVREGRWGSPLLLGVATVIPTITTALLIAGFISLVLERHDKE